jgi:hypothetical protein
MKLPAKALRAIPPVAVASACLINLVSSGVSGASLFFVVLIAAAMRPDHLFILLIAASNSPEPSSLEPEEQAQKQKATCEKCTRELEAGR